MAKKLVETTLYSLSAATPARPDRRNDERYVSLLRVGALTVDGRRELCLIRNISAGGMMIRPYSPIAVGASISVELKQGHSVSGAVQWADKGLVGSTLVLSAIPYYLVAFLAWLYFVNEWGIFPDASYTSPFSNPAKWVAGLLLPWIVLGLYGSTQYARFSRGSMSRRKNPMFRPPSFSKMPMSRCAR